MELLLAMAVALLLALVLGNNRQPTEPKPTAWVKPTTDMMDSFRGTATAEAEKVTPKPQADTFRPGEKSPLQELPSLDRWWFDQRFPNWVSA